MLGIHAGTCFFTNTLFLASKNNLHYLTLTLVQQIFSAVLTVMAFIIDGPNIAGRLVAIAGSLVICLIWQTIILTKIKQLPQIVPRTRIIDNIIMGWPLLLHSMVNIARQRADKIIAASVLSRM